MKTPSNLWLLLAIDFPIILVLFLAVKYFESFKLTFVIPYILLLLPVSYISIKILFKDQTVRYSAAYLKRDLSTIAILSTILYFLTTFFSNIRLGSIYLTLIIAVFSGYFVFILLKDKKIVEDEGRDTINSPKRYLFLIFLLAFVMRFLVFGTPLVPMGYDTPVYLMQAIEGSKLSSNEMISQMLQISSNVYQDTWKFSEVWLGISYKILGLFDLEPEYIAKIVIPFISAFSIVPLFFLAKELTNNNKIALYSSLVFALMPSELLFSGFFKEILGEFFLILSLFLIARFVKNNSLLNFLFLVLTSFFLWKTAVTAFAKFILFGIAFYVNYIVDKKFIIKENKKLSLVLFLALISFIYLKERMSTTFFLSPIYISENIFLSQRFSFGLVTIINLIPFIIFSYYVIKIYFSEEISVAERSILSMSLLIYISLFFYSFIIAGIGSYRIFPSSSFLNSLRFSLYLSIPFSLVSGLFLSKISRTKFSNVTVFIFSVIAVTFFISGNLNTTPAPGHLSSSIDNRVYDTLNSIDYSEYDGVIALGEFDPKFKTMDYSFGNWVRYLVMKNLGKEPILIENTSELDKRSLEAKNYLFLNLSNKRVNDMRSLKDV
ncbi:MAG: hypothetical protein ACXACY_22475 [Candidatus Hodarchaeales archaeon]|jgi:hypothetical protein